MSTASPGLRSAKPPTSYGVLSSLLEGALVHIIPVTDRVLRIGRLPDNEMVLPHPTISRLHAEVRIQNSQPVLTDLGSSAGTFCSGVRLAPNQPVALEPGVEVRVGPYVLRFTPNAPAHAVLPGQPEVADERGPSGPLVAPEVIEELLGPVPGRPTYPVPLPAEAPSRYLQHLPAMFQDDQFLGRFLLIFEALWEPLEWRQDHFDLYFDPRTSPASFLDWLAGWLNLTVNPHWPEDRRRRLLDEAMELYRWRGTPYGLMRMIEVCTGHGVEVTEAGAEPFTFRVRIPPAAAGQGELIEQLVITHKPAHVGYVLEVGA